MDKIKDFLDKNKINKNIAIGGGVVIVGALLYFVYSNFAPSSDTTSGLVVVSGMSGPSNAELAMTSQKFLNELQNIDSIKIDNKIVTNPAFTILKDLSRPIEPDSNPGRINPFAPLGADSAVVSTQIITNEPTLELATSAVLNGTLTVSGPGINRWFEYGKTDALGMTTKMTPQSTAGIFSENIVGLSPDTQYFVKAAASIGGQKIYGAMFSWQTKSIKRVTN